MAQLGIVFSMGQNPQGTNTLGKRLRENYTPLVGFCVMLFMLIGMPCLATVAAARSETGSWGGLCSSGAASLLSRGSLQRLSIRPGLLSGSASRRTGKNVDRNRYSDCGNSPGSGSGGMEALSRTYAQGVALRFLQ